MRSAVAGWSRISGVLMALAKASWVRGEVDRVVVENFREQFKGGCLSLRGIIFPGNDADGEGAETDDFLGSIFGGGE